MRAVPVRKCLAALLVVFSAQVSAAVDAGRVLQLIDYIGVDYPAAVQDGKVVSEAEYAEMREFAANVVSKAEELDAANPGLGLHAPALELQQAIARRDGAERVATLTAAMRQRMVATLGLDVVPRAVPDLERARALYLENCAACHGESGRGDGPLARGMEPPPIDFHDLARYRDRTLYGLYSTIGLGVEGTTMPAYGAKFTEAERWALAFYVGQMAVTPEMSAQGAALWPAEGDLAALGKLPALTTLTPKEAAQRFGPEGGALMAYLRGRPEVLFDHGPAPLAFARETIAKSLETYTAGDREGAYRQALSAYLDGFELAEASVAAVDRQLKLDVEMAMTGYRQLIKRGAPVEEVAQQAASVQALLARSTDLLASRSLSGTEAFSGALVILLREGLEALLVIAALAAFLIKTERRDAMRYLHIGWVGALLLGGLTWYASQYLVSFSGASREITEGVAALIAMAVLFWVGFWLHSKTSVQQWKRFIEGSIHKALSTGTLWGIAGLSFIAVYREVFETILFYQAMWVQADEAARSSLLSGMGTAVGILAVLAWAILRYSARLPLRQFFAVTGVFMFVLAFIFAGKGIAALQEAGMLSLDPVSFPRIDFLGVYPSLQGLGLQLALVILAVFIYFGFSRKQASS